VVDPAPDAGNTVLGHYSLLNPVVAWLLRKAPGLLAEPASALRESDVRPPRCPERHRMVWRGAEYACYLHAEPVRQKIALRYERAPEGDVLSLTDRVLDWRWSDEARRYVMVVTGD